MMDKTEYQRLKGQAEELLLAADKHLMEDTLLLGIGLAIEGQAYATLAAAEASRPAPSRRAVGTMRALQIGSDVEEILDGDDGPVQYPDR